LKYFSEGKVESYQKTLEEKVVVAHIQLEKKVEKVQKEIDSLNIELSYKIMLLNAPRTFTWKIKRFENTLPSAKSEFLIQIESEPFHMSGYKLKLQLKPNGQGIAENTHLSLFIAVMKGEHNAILA